MYWLQTTHHQSKIGDALHLRCTHHLYASIIIIQMSIFVQFALAAEQKIIGLILLLNSSIIQRISFYKKKTLFLFHLLNTQTVASLLPNTLHTQYSSVE